MGSDTGRHLVQVEGHIADPAPSVIGAGLRIIKEAVDEKSILIGGIGAEGVVFRGDAQPDSHILDTVCDGVQRTVQLKRLADIGAADDGIAAADERESFRYGFLFLLIKFLRRYEGILRTDNDIVYIIIAQLPPDGKRELLSLVLFSAACAYR